MRDAAARAGAEEALDESHDVATSDVGFGPDRVLELHQALDRLDRKHREVLVLLFLEGLTVDEIAGIVGVPPGTVKSRVYHAKKALRRLLEGNGHE